MTKVAWNESGERMFEAGVDRGVLYVDPTKGVAWNGLISVAEAPAGGATTPLYIDGQRYFNDQAIEEFEATITAYMYPDEFDVCDGAQSVNNGLSAMHQVRRPFSLSYRTLVGNDVDGQDHGYKIHLVYGALAEPSQRSNNSLSDSIDPFNFSWRIVTVAPRFTGYRPTSHFVVDSRDTPPELLSTVEEILYGSDLSNPRIPNVPELLSIFTSFEAAVFDAGHLTDTYYLTIDAGRVTGPPNTETIDGGSP